MELSKKTTILFPPELFDQLTRVAEQRRTSIGDLVRTACRERYCLPDKAERLRLVGELGSLDLPVGTPGEMKRQSVPRVKPLP